jgi:4-amino-4-deoxy-L-arabinose transferase-like glycosyltransferase
MKKNYIYLSLLIIILLAVVTRYYKLGEIPAGFYVDEAGQGYSAYSILTTGKDEFGKFMPVVFRSLTDFKTPVYIYLIVPLIPIFGLSPFTVRLPSFIFSILTIPLIYLLVINLLNKTKFKQKEALELTSTLLVAISPWHILFGRTNFECNVALLFLLAGIFTFYKGLKKPAFIILSAVLLAIAIPSYHSQRVITPLVSIILFLKYKKILLSATHAKYVLFGFFVAFLISLPTLSVINTPGFLARATGLNIFSHSRQMPDGFIYSYSGILNGIINGSWFLSSREFLSLYFSYLSPRYMFNLGDYGPRSSFPELPTFYLWQFPFYIYGLWRLFKNRNLGELKFLILTLMLISPIPAAVTRDPYTTIRALPLLVPQLIIIALGIVESRERIKNIKIKFAFSIGLLVLVGYSLLKLYSSVFILNEYHRAKAWDYGWREVANQINELNPLLPITVDNARADAFPQLAFFLKYPPDKYQSENFEVDVSEYYTNMRISTKTIGRITARPIVWEKDLAIDQYLIGDELAISVDQIKEHKLELIREIDYPDGNPAFRIVRTNASYEFNKRKLYESQKKNQ